MFEVLLGYITSIADFINEIIAKIQALVSFARGEEQETSTVPPVQDDEAYLQSMSLFND